MRTTLVLALITIGALALRVWRLDGTFESSDSAELAARVLANDGFAWMLREPYGLLISLLVSVSVHGLVALGVPVDELIWRLPVSAAGTSIVPIAWWFARGMGATPQGALVSAAVVAVLPIHVFHSRYLWGYEVLGASSVLLALGSLAIFFASPSRRRGLAATVCIALYLVSHGYIVPFFACLAIAPFVLLAAQGFGPRAALNRGATLYGSCFVWLGVVATIPLFWSALVHTRDKRVRWGFYPEHLAGTVQNLGLPLCLVIAVGIVAFAHRAIRRRRLVGGEPADARILLCFLAGICYIAPIAFGTPPGTTVARGYLLIGPMLCVLSALVAVDRAVARRRGRWLAIATTVVGATLFGTIESFVGRDRWFDPTLVASERGVVVRDPGTKAFGWLARRHLPPTTRVLFLHRAAEPPNVFYYVGSDRERLWSRYDLRRFQVAIALAEARGKVDVVVVDPDQRRELRLAPDFVPLITLHAEGEPVLHAFARPGFAVALDVPVDVEVINGRFDRDCGPLIARALVD